jgi:hypothetical protein
MAGKMRPTIFIIGADMIGRLIAGITKRAINPAPRINKTVVNVVISRLLLSS